jgi:hypothetical protein
MGICMVSLLLNEREYPQFFFHSLRFYKVNEQ